jgi:hypothetical protein
VQRRIGIGLDFFSVAWALILTIVITRFLGQRIDYERPLGQVVALFWHEVRGPRAGTAVEGGQLRSGHVRIGPVGRPRRRPARPQRRPGVTTQNPWPRGAERHQPRVGARAAP